MVVITGNIPHHSETALARFRNSISMKFFWSFCVLAPLLFLIVAMSDGFFASASEPHSNNAASLVSDKDSLVTVSITFAGDLMCHSPQFNNARQSDGTYNFNPSWDAIKPFLSAADFTIGNLETTCAGAGSGFSGYPAFNTPDEYIAALKYAGFDMLATSNNHSMDTGEKGLERTIGIIKQNGLAYTGTFLSQADRDSIRMVDLKGLKIAVLNYTYGTNGAYPSAEHAYKLNVFDSTLVKNDMAAARKNGAEIVLVFYHWGVEYRADPMWPKQDSMMQCAIHAGADLIIGSHPHVVGPVTFYKGEGSKLDSGLVAWTMGNFISNQSKRYQDAGLVLTVELTKNVNTGAVSISKTSYMPTWVYRGTDPSNKNYVVMPANLLSTGDSVPSWIREDSKLKMNEAFSDTKAMVTRYSNKPEIMQVNKAISKARLRKIVYKPEIKNPISEAGIVALTLSVNREGNVVNAQYIPSKSTTTNAEQIAAAKQSALQIRFDSCSDCPEKEIIEIEIKFTAK